MIGASWQHRLFARLRRYFLIKALGTTAFITIFFVGYFHILRSTAHLAATMPVTALDDLVGFQPAGLYPYLTLWIYVGLPPAILYSLRELVVYGGWVGALCVTGLACFWFWPTAVPPYPVDVGLYPSFRLLQGLDAAGNACPSLHVATAAFSALWLDRQLAELGAGWRPRTFNWVWFAAIAWSTMATRQHVALDVLAGCALGIAFALASRRWRPRSHAQPVSYDR